jgi:hypothetical protein
VVAERTESYVSQQERLRTLQQRFFLQKYVLQRKQNPQVRDGRQPVFEKCLIQKDTIPKLRLALSRRKQTKAYLMRHCRNELAEV